MTIKTTIQQYLTDHGWDQDTYQETANNKLLRTIKHKFPRQWDAMKTESFIHEILIDQA